MARNETKDHELLNFLESNKDQGRTMLLPALIKTQKLFGFISKDHARKIGNELEIPLADISGVIEFYSMLYDHQVGDTKIRICTSPVCVTKGSNKLFETARDIKFLDQEKDYLVESVACLGLCDHAPSAMVDEIQIGNATIDKIMQRELVLPTQIYGDERIITKNLDYHSQPTLQKYIDNHGFQALTKVFSMPPIEAIETVKSSGLLGRGGAGFPTGIKWEGAFQAENESKFVVCNVDESEPGNFKDQALILGNPFLILEGMIIAAYSIGAQKGYCYIRGEYPSSQKMMEKAITQAVEAGYLGDNILGTNFSFHVELRSGAGAYICGEETALFESIEGKRGFPRIKPPFPTTHGLFGKPTVINNVETFSNLPIIFNLGIKKYRTMGSDSVPGPRLFSLSGDIAKPGIYELTKPMTLKKLLYEIAGGIPDQKELQGILLGGAAGKFLGPNMIDILLSEESVRQHGFTLGSGAIMVFDTSRNMREILASAGTFFAHESCGKCFPCQLGTQRQAEILNRNFEGSLLPGDIARLKDIGGTMTDASLCGLGQTAGLFVLSAIDLWPDLFIEKGQSIHE